MSELKRTPLFPLYKEYGAKTVDFGGWELPVQFSGILEEHEAVRTKAGLFDVSHMGEVEVKGEDALALIQKLVTNDAAVLEDNQAQYCAMCYPNGGTVDDLLVYKRGEGDYLLVINASNIDKDVEWIKQHAAAFANVTVNNISEEIALLALQGPLAEQVLQKLTATDLSQVKPFHFLQDVELNGVTAVMVSRSGYTGEDGFEIYLPAAGVQQIWKEILEVGKPEGILPCGLGARDTLRFEARLPLYGQELGADISPLEAGIGFAVKTDKESDFIGKEALKAQKQNGVPRKLAGIEMIDRGIPRHGYPVYADGVQIGEVTTGTQSPTLKKNVGLALIKSEFAELGREVEVEIRGKKLKAVVVRTPFYRRAK